MCSKFGMCLIISLLGGTALVYGEASEEESASKNNSRILLLASGLLILTVLTIWLLKTFKVRNIHETGLCLFCGIIVGLIIRYGDQEVSGMSGVHINASLDYAPNTLWVHFNKGKNYSYERKEELVVAGTAVSQGFLSARVTFDPEVFFYGLLPPIIFFAGYDMKKRFFFRNLGATLAFAFIGTTISTLVFAGLTYLYVYIIQPVYSDFGFHECLVFGSLISATDPVTVLAIFQDLQVEVDLYAMVFGESVMNDAVAIVLYRSVMTYKNKPLTALIFFEALGTFFGVFLGSLLIGCVMGLINALLTKQTNIRSFPRLETALFTLMSYTSFLISELAGLSGIVTVLFCGIVQAHYTYNNLTERSQLATKEIFGLLNFVAENFIFLYMGFTVFTFDEHRWDAGFIAWSLLCCALSRAMNIYPLSFLMNLKRTEKIPFRLQHMLWFSGLRGAVAFALAIRNTASVPRQLILTSVLVVAVVTVIVNGTLATRVLSLLKIKVNVDPNEVVERSVSSDNISHERSWLVQKWHDFDVKYMKNLFSTREGQQGGSSIVMPSFCRVLCSCCLKKGSRSESLDDGRQHRDERPSYEEHQAISAPEVPTPQEIVDMSNRDGQELEVKPDTCI